MTIEWRPVDGWPGYEVSDQGRARSLNRVIVDCNGHRRRYKGRQLTLTTNNLGYPVIGLRAGPRKSIALVHQLVCRAFHGEPAPGQEVRHLNGVALDCRAANLRWGTHSENMFDRVRHGTHPEVLRTECPRSHALKEPNLRPSQLAVGKRACLACNRASSYCWSVGNSDPEFFKATADRYYQALMSGVVA